MESLKKYDFKKVKQSALEKYQSAGIFDASDLEWLLACALKKNRTQLLLVKEVSKKEYETIKRALKKRLQHVPVSKIFHSANFYGLDFYVNKNVLSPRGETEILVEKALDLLRGKNGAQVLDLCSGSGAVGITIKNKNPFATVTCLDISTKALYIAKKNAKKHNANVKFVQSNMFEALKKKQAYDMIISNPPYIKTNELTQLDDEVKENDPLLALDGGYDGLQFYRIISENAQNHLKEDGVVLLEIGFDQADKVKTMFENKFEKVEVLKDYSGNDRVIICRLAKKGLINND